MSRAVMNRAAASNASSSKNVCGLPVAALGTAQSSCKGGAAVVNPGKAAGLAAQLTRWHAQVSPGRCGETARPAQLFVRGDAVKTSGLRV